MIALFPRKIAQKRKRSVAAGILILCSGVKNGKPGNTPKMTIITGGWKFSRNKQLIALKQMRKLILKLR